MYGWLSTTDYWLLTTGWGCFPTCIGVCIDFIRNPCVAHLKHVLQLPRHGDYVMLGRVVLVAVGEYQTHVRSKFRRHPVLPSLHLGSHCSKVHWLLDNLNTRVYSSRQKSSSYKTFNWDQFVSLQFQPFNHNAVEKKIHSLVCSHGGQAAQCQPACRRARRRLSASCWTSPWWSHCKPSSPLSSCS